MTKLQIAKLEEGKPQKEHGSASNSVKSGRKFDSANKSVSLKTMRWSLKTKINRKNVFKRAGPAIVTLLG